MMDESRKQKVIDRVIETAIWFAIPPPKTQAAQIQRGFNDMRGLSTDEQRFLAGKMMQVQRCALEFKGRFPPETALRMIIEIVEKVEMDTDIDSELLRMLAERTD